MLKIIETIDRLTARGGSDFSDLHLVAGQPPFMRMGGALNKIDGAEVLTTDDIEAMLKDLLSEAQWKEFTQNRELDAGLTVGDGHRLRVNVYLQQGTPAAAIRILPDVFFSFEKIGLPVKVLSDIAAMHSGLVLVTGATGSGKSTTIASLVNYINTHRSCHIHTIEDPVEYRHASQKALVTQREVGSDTASFSEALRRSMREDPDVIVVGEMRDRETTSSALTLAETGHLTFATLHTSDAVQTISRIISQYPAEQIAQVTDQLASTLRVVICQRLVPWSRGGGRSVAAEILVANSAVRSLIRDGKVHQLNNVIQTGQADGMQTLTQSLQSLVESGQIDGKTVAAYTT